MPTSMRKNTDNMLTIGEVAKRSGSPVSAIRFYADRELIPSSRTEGGQRLFRREVIRRVSFILISQQLGYTLNEIQAQLATLPDNRTPTQKDWRTLSKSFSEDINARIFELQQLRDTLSSCIGCGCLSLQKCKLYNPDDQAARLGSGPRYLKGDKPPGS